MNDYIELDGKRYRTGHPDWEPIEDRPMTVKRLLSGATNITFGPATFTSWAGIIHADVSASAPFGTIDDLRVTSRKREVLSFTDHYGVSASVVIDRRVGGRSLSPMWDAADNVWRMNITLLKVSQ